MNSNLKPLTRPLLMLVIFNLIPQIGLRPWWTTLVCAIMIGYRCWLELNNGHMPRKWVMTLGQVTIAAAIWIHYHSFFGDEAGGAFLTLLLCVKSFELRRKRDYFLTAILCVLVLMSYLLLEQGLMMTAFLLVDVILVMTFLLALEDEHWKWRAWKPLLGPSFWMAMKALPLLIAMFLLFPRFSTGFGSGSNLIGKTGVSDTLRPGAIAHLIASDELVFRATFLNGDALPHSQLYWRGAVLDRSNGLNWDRSKSHMYKAQPLLNSLGHDIEIYLEPGFDKFIFSLESTKSISFPNDPNLTRVHPREGKTFELVEPLQLRERYYVQKAQANELAADKDDAPDDYLEVQEAPSVQLQKFLRPFAHKRSGEAVKELLAVFHSGGYQYSLDPPSVGSMDDFLFKTKIGFCEHYAGSFATLLRDLDIPARVVVGYQGGTPSFLENYISVRGHDAHAWVEYYDQQDQRWRRVDPTAQVAPLRLSLGSDSYFERGRKFVPSWMGDWSKLYFRSRAFLDQVEASWIGFLLRFDLSRQKELLAKLGIEGVLFRALFVFILLSLALALALVYFYESSRREPLSQDEKLYRQLLSLLRKWRIYKSPQEGPLTLLAKVHEEDRELSEVVERILEPLILARFGREPLTAQVLTSIRQQLRHLRRLKVRVNKAR